MEKTSLSGLCATCHAEPPKYRCPRCETQTCSLACFKRHKHRASCSGVRDPTTFVKKSQWATPAGVDHDYNYLKSLERSIDGAGNETQARGIGIDNPSAKGQAKARMAGTTLEKYLTHNRITVDRAPLGMSRQKNNQTRSSKKGNIIWTVEWIGDDNEHLLYHDCPASTSFIELFKPIEPLLRGTSPDQIVGKKRKRRQAEFELQASSQEIKQDPVGPTITESNHEGGSFAKPEDHRVSEVEQQSDTPAKIEDEDNQGAGLIKVEDHVVLEGRQELHALVRKEDGEDQGPSPLNIQDHEAPGLSTTYDVDSCDSPSSIDIITEAKQATTPYIYLFMPGTIGKSRVLIPLDPQTTLTDALKNRAVREYPTLYALRASPAELPDPFMLEVDYLKSLPSERPVDTLASGGLRTASTLKSEPQALDANSILKMLRRDVTT